MKDKKRNKEQQKQAAHAISIFYEIKWYNSNKKGDNKARTIKNRLTPPNTIEKLLINADWASAAYLSTVHQGPLCTQGLSLYFLQRSINYPPAYPVHYQATCRIDNSRWKSRFFPALFRYLFWHCRQPCRRAPQPVCFR